MKSRKLHRTLGLIMLLPLLGWAVTGLIFFIKPGYQGAYAQLSLKTYALEQALRIPPDVNWQQARILRSALGTHLLIDTDEGPRHLNPITLKEQPLPDPQQLKILFSDAISTNVERYGEIKTLEQNRAYTTTGIKIEINWPTMTFSQYGPDREIIDSLYDIHYLRWTPWSSFNNILGGMGLLFLTLLSILGISVYLKK